MSSNWYPSKKPGQSSLRNIPDVTPDMSLCGGHRYFAGKGSISRAEFSNSLHSVINGGGSEIFSKTHLVTEVVDRDKNLPNDWITRHPYIVRLTAKQPFNFDPLSGALLHQGVISPISQQYFFNHVKAPKLDWDFHLLHIKGLVDTPITFTMNDIVAMPSVTISVTLVCAGNRRKDDNMVNQTIGYSWGCSAYPCNFWTNVKFPSTLERAGVDMERAKHVCFVISEVLGVPNGTNGTSIDIAERQ